MAVELKVPEVGESITEVEIGEWLKSEGDQVEQDEVVVMIETDKVTVELPAPVTGVISEIRAKKGESASVGDVIGYMEEGASSEAKSSARSEKAESGGSERSSRERRDDDEQDDGRRRQRAEGQRGEGEQKQREGGEREQRERRQEGDEKKEEREQRERGGPKEQREQSRGSEERRGSRERDDDGGDGASDRVMPAARRALHETGARAEDVERTGPGGRLLKEDVERHARKDRARDGGAREEREPQPTESAYRQEDVVAMTPMRRRIAERLVESQKAAALLTTFNEADMSEVISLRKEYKEAFQNQYGIKLGFMSFFVKAVVDALKQVPQVNAEIRGNDIVYRNYQDIGVAVGGGRGLVVPVIRNAERLSFAEIEQAIADFAKRAQNNALKLDELQGGTFTISNGGVYGSMMSTPIINPPQSGILGLHAIQERPVARDGQVVIRPMMYLALTYDHRLVDGREAVTFLKRIKEAIEQPARMLLEV